MVIKAGLSTKPFISPDEFAKRRANLAAQCGAGSIIFLLAAPEVSRNADCEYPYRQHSDFVYLTGFEEPQAVAVLMVDENDHQYHLYCRERDPAKEIWVGARVGIEGAVKDYYCDKAFSITQFNDNLPNLLSHRDKIYFAFGFEEQFEKKLTNVIKDLSAQSRKGVRAPSKMVDVKPLIAEMRLFKSKSELAAIQKACDITCQAHARAMQVVKPGMYEFELEAELQHEFLRHGARAPAYSSIVGAGANACILHYIENTGQIEKDDLVLIDAGAEIDNYASDVTRTFPASGQFNEAQRQVYELVLSAQIAAINHIKPGVVYTEIQEIVVDVLTEGFLALGLLQGDKAKLIEDKTYQKFYMHSAGHWMGLDVHDAGAYVDPFGKPRKLAPGMVLTVEPGVYINAEAQVDEKWKNIGIRIEDDVLVTEEGAEVLTSALPKSIEDIESLMKE